jgi:hypothetical protein
MLTLFNIINYYFGKPLPFYILILLTIGIYFYIISTHWETISSNKVYLTTNIILLLIDITAIIMIYTVYHDIIEDNPEKSIKSKKHKKKSRLHHKKNSIETNLIQNNIEDIDNSLLSVYDNKKDVSLKTYNVI